MAYQRAIVVGASSGMGLEITRQLLEAGCKVAAVSRREEPLADLLKQYGQHLAFLRHDVCHTDEVELLFEKACTFLGGLELFVYSSGVLHDAPETVTNRKGDLEMVSVNVAGAVSWIDCAADRMMGQGFGTIIGIGSVAGVRGRRRFPVYCASKAFLHTYLEGMRHRASETNVQIITVKPGPVATPMTAGLSGVNKMPVQVAAKKILSFRRSGEYFLTLKERLIFGILRILPSALFKKIRR